MGLVNFNLPLHIMDKPIAILERRVHMNTKYFSCPMPVRYRDAELKSRETELLSVDSHLKGNLA